MTIFVPQFLRRAPSTTRTAALDFLNPGTLVRGVQAGMRCSQHELGIWNAATMASASRCGALMWLVVVARPPGQTGTLAEPVPSPNGAMRYRRALLLLGELGSGDRVILDRPDWRTLAVQTDKRFPVGSCKSLDAVASRFGCRCAPRRFADRILRFRFGAKHLGRRCAGRGGK